MAPTAKLACTQSAWSFKTAPPGRPWVHGLNYPMHPTQQTKPHWSRDHAAKAGASIFTGSNARTRKPSSTMRCMMQWLHAKESNIRKRFWKHCNNLYHGHGRHHDKEFPDAPKPIGINSPHKISIRLQAMTFTSSTRKPSPMFSWSMHALSNQNVGEWP